MWFWSRQATLIQLSRFTLRDPRIAFQIQNRCLGNYIEVYDLQRHVLSVQTWASTIITNSRTWECKCQSWWWKSDSKLLASVRRIRIKSMIAFIEATCCYLLIKHIFLQIKQPEFSQGKHFFVQNTCLIARRAFAFPQQKIMHTFWRGGNRPSDHHN